MTISIFLISVLVISVNIFITGTIAGFLQKKPDMSQLLRLILTPATLGAFVLLVGVAIGKLFISYFHDMSSWYAATILFLLSIKLAYDGMRLHKIRQSVNPLNSQGLLAISTFISFNSLFTGMAFGLLNIPYSYIAYAFIIFISAMLLGYFRGFKMNKLISLKVDVYSAIFFFLCALFIILKF